MYHDNIKGCGIIREMRNIKNLDVYLERMAKPLAEKLKIVKYLPEGAENVLDVGCADGAITLEMSSLLPEIKFLGIDLNEDFIGMASKKAVQVPNVKFEKIYLRELLAKPKRFDAVIFCSVLHEFYTYGEGISSVLKALADAHELLRPGGVIIVRDMVLSEYTKKANLRFEQILEKIRSKKEWQSSIKDFENCFGKLNNIYRINHFLLKYWYRENWNRECKENYVPVTFEEYEKIFSLLGMTFQYKDTYLIPYLKEKWQKDFGLTDDEISEFHSTSFLVAQKLLLDKRISLV